MKKAKQAEENCILQGDSGGPLICETLNTGETGKMEQYGVVSKGEPCTTGDFPVVYSRVDTWETRNWIQQVCLNCLS